MVSTSEAYSEKNNMAKKIYETRFDVRSERSLNFFKEGNKKPVLLSNLEVGLRSSVHETMALRGDSDGVVCYLTQEEFERARGWNEGSCWIDYQESLPVQGKNAYCLQVFMSSPGNHERIAFHTHDMPRSEDIAELILDHLDSHEYQGDVTLFQNSPNGSKDGTYPQVRSELEKNYKRGKILEQK